MKRSETSPIRITRGHRAPRRRVGPPGRERGAALLVALVLVVACTLLGVSVMRGSNIETRLVANEGFRQSAFRAAESVAQRELPATDIGTLIGEGTRVLVVPSLVTHVAIEAEARFEGSRPRTGFSLGTFQDNLYAIEATATIESVDSRHTIVQGAARLGASVAP